jgi:hypothetical protein
MPLECVAITCAAQNHVVSGNLLAGAPWSPAMPRTGEPLDVLAQHLLHGFDAGRETEALE